MKKISRIANFAFILLLAGCSACGGKNKPAIEVNDDGSVEVNPTAAAESEFLTQTQMAGVVATRQSLIGEVDATAEGLRPTDDPSTETTPEPTMDPISAYTPPPTGSTTVQLSNTTNCRSGPGTNYAVLDVVPAGQPVEVLGVDSSGAYYVVQSPKGEICWLWSHYATVNGNTDALAQMTPPAPPIDVYTGDWIEPVTIQVSDEFSWQGHWVVGAYDGGSFKDLVNSNNPYSDQVTIDYYELDVFQTGNFLDIELTESVRSINGFSTLYVFYGIAQLTNDDSMAAGKFYRYEISQTDNQNFTQTITKNWDVPILWYQNGDPNQFIGDYSSGLAPCGARGDSELPFPCIWP